MSPVSTYSSWERDELRTLGYLVPAIARSSESTILLVAYGQLWDAEVTLRSVAEGTLKFCYLLQSKSTFKQRHREYSDCLWEISLLKDHRKAAELLKVIPNRDDSTWRPIRDRLLDDAARDRISSAYDQSRRRSLEARWGFAGLLAELTRSGDPDFVRFAGFAHSYSLASHIQHADYVGISLPWDRESRSVEQRDTLQLAHAGRLISDVFTFLELRLKIGYRFVEADTGPLVEQWAKVKGLKADFQNAYANWMSVEYPD
ncbi:MAG: DUF5677 domain-containing protein [Proteobacteria bacterium]|nr:DUF5677 domain-containing protein [Pseudomonadota bacterium]